MTLFCSIRFSSLPSSVFPRRGNYLFLNAHPREISTEKETSCSFF